MNTPIPLILHLFLLIWIFALPIQTTLASEPDNNVSIGVLAYNGKQQTMLRWKPTANYLGEHIPSHSFNILPLAHEELVHAINKGQVDFILTNPGHYIDLEVKFGATRIATFKSRFNNQVLTRFGAVVFTLTGGNIKQLSSLKNRNVAAVSEAAFGGFQMAHRELLLNGINAYDDLSLMWLGFPQKDIVRAVIAGTADAGIVRTGILEKMIASGEIDQKDIRVLAPKQNEDFPLRLSTDLYPEWPIARLPETDPGLAKQVAITLLQMPEQALPAIASGGAGWTIPLDYLNVHEMFRDLQIDPYHTKSSEFPGDSKTYKYSVISLSLLLTLISFIMFFVLRNNRRLKFSEQSLKEQRNTLANELEHYTGELNQVNSASQAYIESRNQFENISHEGSETLQAMENILDRQDLNREQRIQSFVDVAQQYLGEEVAAFSVYDGKAFTSGAYCPDNDTPVSLLSNDLASQALKTNQIIQVGENLQWQSYLAYAFKISDDYTGLLELATPIHSGTDLPEHKTTLQFELGLRIFSLIAHNIANEIKLLRNEGGTDEKLQQSQSRFDHMTKRESEVLQLVANGESNKSIARELDISTKTVELHRANLLRKTSTKSSVKLVKLATQAMLVD